MTDEIRSRRALRESTKGPSRRAWIIRWALVGIGAALLFVVAWVGIRGLIAKAQLESALPLVSELKDDLKAVDLSGAQGRVAAVAERTASARALTSDPLWRVLELVPGAGPNLTGFRELAAVTDDLAQGVMVPVASLADTLDPKALKPVDGRIDVSLFAAAVPVISSARESLEATYADVEAIDTSRAIGAIQDAHAQLQGMLKPMLPLVKQADEFLVLLPGMLGADGPRNYLVVFQNNSESRSLGGHAGSWVLVNVDDGKIDLSRQASVHELKTGGVPVIHLTPAQLALWPGSGSDPSNVTMVPDLETSAHTAAAFWSNKFGVIPDGVVFIDPVALGYVLAAVGDVELPSGDVINSANAAQFLLNGVYIQYPDPATQDAIFGSLAETVFGAILGGDFDPKELVEGAMKAGDEHRLLVWFFDEATNAAFAEMPFRLPSLALTDDVAAFGVYITDNLGSKMTYYVDATVNLGQQECAAGGVQYQVRLMLTNIVTPEQGPTLPTYVANKAQGALRVLVSLYAPPGSQIIGAEGWDPDFVPVLAQDGDHPAVAERLILNPGESKHVVFTVAAPDDNADRKLEAYVTPLARPIPVDSSAEFTC